MINNEIVRKACANDYKFKKLEQGHVLEGFFLDTYQSILNGELTVNYDQNVVLEFIKVYKLNVEQITTDNGSVCTVFTRKGESSKPTIEEAVYHYVAEFV